MNMYFSRGYFKLILKKLKDENIVINQILIHLTVLRGFFNKYVLLLTTVTIYIHT
jgi:hypothetical protein